MIQNIAAERATLAGVAQYGDKGYIEVYDIIETDSYTTDINQVLWKCFTNLAEQGRIIDAISLFSSAEELGVEKYLQSKQSADYIQSLFTFPIKQESVREHAQQIA